VTNKPKGLHFVLQHNDDWLGATLTLSQARHLARLVAADHGNVKPTITALDGLGNVTGTFEMRKHGNEGIARPDVAARHAETRRRKALAILADNPPAVDLD
jgi:hypothetical protein